MADGYPTRCVPATYVVLGMRTPTGNIKTRDTVIVGIPVRFRRKKSPRSHPAKVIFPCSDDDRPPDDGVGPDEPHHSVFQVHLAHASIVRVYVPCDMAGRQEHRAEKLLLMSSSSFFGVTVVPSGGVRERRGDEARDRALGVYCSVRGKSGRGLLNICWTSSCTRHTLFETEVQPLLPKKNNHDKFISFSSYVSTCAFSPSAFLLLFFLLPFTRIHFPLSSVAATSGPQLLWSLARQEEIAYPTCIELQLLFEQSTYPCRQTPSTEQQATLLARHSPKSPTIRSSSSGAP